MMKRFLNSKARLELRGDCETLAIAFYLLNCPEALSSALGIFQMPTVMMDHILGMSEGKITKALKRLADLDVLVYDLEYGMVFVKDAAKDRFGETPNLKNKQLFGLAKRFETFKAQNSPESSVWTAFEERYREPWHEFFYPSNGAPAVDAVDVAPTVDVAPPVPSPASSVAAAPEPLSW